MLFSETSVEARRRAHEILGAPEHQMVRRWAEVEILNGISHATLWLGSDVVWSGIVRQDDPGLATLCTLYEQLQVSFQPLESGIHY